MPQDLTKQFEALWESGNWLHFVCFAFSWFSTSRC